MLILPGLDKENYDKYLSMCTVDVIDEFEVRFLHYNHLLENKRASNRPKDQLDVLELESFNQKTNHYNLMSNNIKRIA